MKPINGDFWVSTPIYTVWMKVKDSKIIDTAAITKWSIGKNFADTIKYFGRRWPGQIYIAKLNL